MNNASVHTPSAPPKKFQPFGTAAPAKNLHDSGLSDENLFKLCKQYGENARLWHQKFAGLLPEVNKRHLYEKKGFKTIFDFARLLAGMSEPQVRRVLNLDKNFEDKPVLKSLLINGEVSIHKLARITAVVTTENQEIWAEQVRLLPNRALETLVRDEKNAISAINARQKSDNKNALQKPLFDDKNVHVHSFEVGETHSKTANQFELLKLQLTPKNLQKLLDLQQKDIDINILIEAMLEQREQEIAQEKEKISAAVNACGQAKSRYIPAKIKNILLKEYGTGCSIKGCKKPKKEIHHTQRFSLAKTHDPKYLAPVCKEHHLIAQTIDVKYHQVRTAAIRV